MTIILQHQFWDLKVGDDEFEVGLSFGGIPERLDSARTRRSMDFSIRRCNLACNSKRSPRAKSVRRRRMCRTQPATKKKRLPAGPPASAGQTEATPLRHVRRARRQARESEKPDKPDRAAAAAKWSGLTVFAKNSRPRTAPHGLVSDVGRRSLALAQSILAPLDKFHGEGAQDIRQDPSGERRVRAIGNSRR